MDNTPIAIDSWGAIQVLATEILDPLVDRYGPLLLSYGFAGKKLLPHIERGIAPRLDQHASHELLANGRPICSRLGAAADFYVPGEKMSTVVDWLSQELPFDRTYFYGDDRPVHISAGPDHTRQVVDLLPTPSGKRIPRVRRRKD